ncbi:MAG: hypothetical protein HOO06_06255 [Bdellovibrionaceae bacterium]|nr:hypothetical protein [Pseudobdellovibrionaceae bacterium]
MKALIFMFVLAIAQAAYAGNIVCSEKGNPQNVFFTVDKDSNAIETKELFLELAFLNERTQFEEALLSIDGKKVLQWTYLNGVLNETGLSQQILQVWIDAQGKPTKSVYNSYNDLKPSYSIEFDCK